MVYIVNETCGYMCAQRNVHAHMEKEYHKSSGKLHKKLNVVT